MSKLGKEKISATICLGLGSIPYILIALRAIYVAIMGTKNCYILIGGNRCETLYGIKAFLYSLGVWIALLFSAFPPIGISITILLIYGIYKKIKKRLTLKSK